MSEEQKPTEVTIYKRDKVELFFQGERGEYILSIPAGSPLPEAMKVGAIFLQALDKEYKHHRQKVLEAEKGKNEQSDSNQSQAGDSEK